MKYTFLTGIWLLGASGSALDAQVILTSSSLPQAIPDGTATGLSSTLNLPPSGSLPVISAVTVTLSLIVPPGKTGWIGDIYGYLQHGSAMSVLLNRPGRSTTNPDGYPDGGPISLTFADSAANGDIHTYRAQLNGNEDTDLSTPLTGFWQPDGRAIDPATALTTTYRTALLSGFAGLDASGSWNLFLADLSSGGEFTLNAWSISIEQVAAVPEPGAAGVIGAGLLAFAVWRRRK